jgi:hypothetical protein
MITIASDAAGGGKRRTCSRPVTGVLRRQSQYAHLVNNVQYRVKIDVMY